MDIIKLTGLLFIFFDVCVFSSLPNIAAKMDNILMMELLCNIYIKVDIIYTNTHQQFSNILHS